MQVAGNPFLDQHLIRDFLYAGADRLSQRSSALHRAKTHGRYTPHVIAELATIWLSVRLTHRTATEAPGPRASRSHVYIVDVGCGRGSTTLALADALPTATVLGIDLSNALLSEAARRLRIDGQVPNLLCADFHEAPLADTSCDLIVAAFCLYHAHEPATVIAEFARCLDSQGVAILVTKSRDSYRELDFLVADSGLDPAAAARPNLYETAHSENLAALAATALTVQQVLHEEHRFRFAGLDHIAEYLATSPKYYLPSGLAGDPTAMAAALRERLPDRPLTVTSTVTHVVASRE